ncbi:MAG: hypothetical protein IKP96_03625 [Elusimicrobiaceae bacterium]|nr:hypothetical protein [Elusimicrobiaceae bacterium]
MMKTNKILLFFLVGLFLMSTTVVWASGAAKQLSKGISLYDANKDEKAMDYFIDVLVNGTAEEIATANKYITLIHNRIGGIQTPVEVDVNFKEGEVRSLSEVTDDAVQQAQQAAQAEAERIRAAQQAAVDQAVAKQQEALDAVNAQQQSLTERIEAEKLAAQERAQGAIQNAQNTLEDDWNTALDSANQVQNDVREQTREVAQQAQNLQAGLEDDWNASLDTLAYTDPVETGSTAVPVVVSATSSRDNMMTTVNGESAFTDLTSPQAIEARELYTSQKIASMKQAAIDKINSTKGVDLYMRDDRPDALDIDPEIIFDNNSFRTDALPLLNSIYELLALTQGSAYVILPPGSYTDDVTLPGIRQAMALNSYLINRGISQGKVHYNMGLVDEEPPARFANLHGLSIVFDYDAKLPTVLEKNEKDETAPLLSMAIVPLCHAIDRSLGEAFAIDFSVLETVNPLDNWVLQVVQHGHDGKYYVVRQLEGFAPVYHQILFNGRKGIIGPELPCGKYTLVLTGTDLKGVKQTLRRRVIVKCADQGTVTSCTGTCRKQAVEKKVTNLNYKAARLWTKPGRKMNTVKEVAVAETKADSSSSSASTSTYTKTVNTTTIIQEDDGTDPLPASSSTTTTTVNTLPAGAPYPTADEILPANNPYDMPYEEYNN